MTTSEPIARCPTLHAIVREAARSAPDRIALIDGDTSFSYRLFHRRVAHLASALRAMGVGAGDRIVWLGQNSHRWMETLVAAGRIGAMMCSLNWRLSPTELAATIDAVSPKLVIFQQADLATLSLSVKSLTSVTLWLAHDDESAGGYEALLAAASPLPDSEDPGDPDAPVLVLSVANSEGGSLASMLSHQNLIVPAFLMAQLQDIDRNTVNLASAPLFHIAALFSIIPTLLMRGVNVFVARPDPELLCRAIDTHRCTHGFLLAPTAEAIVAIDPASRYDLSCFRSNLPLPAWRALVRSDDSAWGRNPGGYGQTETHMAVLAALGDGASMTSGWAAPHAEVIIADADGVEVSDGEVGQILVRGPNVHLGYWQRPDVNDRRFRNGWWHTKDLGRRSADGMISFVGPVGRMLKSGAENVYAAEVEQCLAKHEDVAEVAIIGIPDEVWIQSVCAVVVLNEGAALAEDALRDFCRETLASYKKPRKIIFRTEPLPRKGFGPDYAALDAIYGGGGYPGEGTRSA
jgi:acyl-CoA synthetase (AMP-forming)/AMP-acid ligase II